jgi:hypothetical protein
MHQPHCSLKWGAAGPGGSFRMNPGLLHPKLEHFGAGSRLVRGLCARPHWQLSDGGDGSACVQMAAAAVSYHS